MAENAVMASSTDSHDLNDGERVELSDLETAANAEPHAPTQQSTSLREIVGISYELEHLPMPFAWPAIAALTVAAAVVGLWISRYKASIETPLPLEHSIALVLIITSLAFFLTLALGDRRAKRMPWPLRYRPK
jgi:hypothetical protein